MVIIPTFQKVSSKFIQKIDLDGITYQLLLYWNTREDAWYLSILSIDGIMLHSGMKLTPDYGLNNQYKYKPELPPGKFYVMDMMEDYVNSGITFDNLGVRYQLLYLTQSEME